MVLYIRAAAPLRRQFRAVQLRCFSVSASRDAQWGFIGLGQMGTFHLLDKGPSIANISVGYNMAKNLQKKLPPTDTLLIQDINSDATARFVAEIAQTGGAAVRVASSPAEASDGSVSIPFLL